MEKKKIKVIWASLMAPYDRVRHASGKIENFFLKKLHASDEFDFRLISFATKKEENDLDLDKYGITNSISIFEWNLKYRCINAIGKLNIFSSSAGLTSPYYVNTVVKEMNKLKKSGFIPDIIIMDWTEIATGLEKYKKIFPDAKTVIIEEDVSFLGHTRKAEAASRIKHIFLKEKAARIKTRELELLNKADLVVLNNKKDYKLIINDVKNIEKLWVWCPYYQSMLQYSRKAPNRDILFYGALSRIENWKTALWFLENVWPKIEAENVRYVMIGNNPPEVLKSYQSDRVIVTGFVDEIHPYFESALCLAAPLVLGAGVKIKVIEGLSSGIPVLTNDIGIEGIPAEDKKEFFYCVTPDDYIRTIKKLLNGEIDLKAIEQNGKAFIRNNFNYEKDAVVFANKLKELL
ncbi:glycosyltransferase [Ruminococcus sp.]|uniref:glycosyltransferase n=1 Tax=Ruminococcus sp. TaxID=41978 RepID=UPI0025FC1B80|nr:glycosyltransferase [Ruminococcus sp.]